MKSAFVSILGRPSAGKSTLINTLCGEKVSIVSPIPQTTRNAIRGIINRPQGQLVFVDTPGYHHSEKNFNLQLKEVAESSLEGIDLILYLLDSTRSPGAEENSLAELLATHDKKAMVIGINKVDHPKSHPVEITEWVAERFPDAPIFPLSALKEKGIEEMLSALFDAAPEGMPMYPDDIYTDQEPEFRVQEVIREKAIKRAKEELPHALYVEISDMEMKDLDNGKSSLWVRAFLMVERESQKGILVGKGGKIIKEIRLEAQKELNELFPYRVNLDLMVKVKKKWRRNATILKDLIN